MLAAAVPARAVTPIHVTVVMHSEQSYRYDLNALLFESARTNLAAFARMLSGHGIPLNFQSDWTFLTGVTNFDQFGHADTGGTNIIAWMYNDLGFSIDPHNHMDQSIYNLADVAALIGQCGVEPSGVVGGFIAMPATQSNWRVLQQPITGAVYTGTVWTPQILWGGGTGSHVDETNTWFSGIYCPLDETNFWTHQDGNLPVIGKYAGRDEMWASLDALIAWSASGQLCTDRLYTINVMLNMSELSAAALADFDARFTIYTNEPALRFVRFAEITNNWATEYGRVPSYLPFDTAGDLDEDGMPDGWEVTNFCGIVDQDADGDADGDGMGALAEYLTGTSPTNTLDFYGIRTVEPDPSGMIFRWRTTPGLTGIVQRTEGTGDSWVAVYTGVAPANVLVYTNTTALSGAWYRVVGNR